MKATLKSRGRRHEVSQWTLWAAFLEIDSDKV
jgi:hypothetical protein